MSWYGRTQTHSGPHRRQHLHCLLEQRSEVNRNQYCEQLSASWKRAWQSSACVSPTETLNTDLVPDIEAPREDVEIGNEEDEEPLDAEVPRTRMNPKNPTSRKKNKNMKVQYMLSTEVGVLLVSKVVEFVDSIVLNS